MLLIIKPDISNVLRKERLEMTLEIGTKIGQINEWKLIYAETTYSRR